MIDNALHIWDIAPTHGNNTHKMRTKALIIAAAGLCVSLLQSNAQTPVYSQNIVGYYNTVIPSGSFELVANQLINGSDANATNNSINSIFNGLVSDPNGNNNSTLYLWNGNGYAIYQYFTASDADSWFGADSGNGFYDSIGDFITASLPQGSGSFLYNPSGNAITNTTVGSVVQGTNVLTITTGFNIYSFIQPVSGGVASTNSFASFPGTSDPDANNNDVLYLWNGNGYAVYQYFTAADADSWFGADSGNGFYDSIGDYVTANVPVGQAFFIDHLTAPVTWTTSLTVQ